MRRTPSAMDRAPRSLAKAAAVLCAVTVVLLARPATAAELATLRNGFTIRHEHRLVMGTTTRLYLAADDSSFTDVPYSTLLFQLYRCSHRRDHRLRERSVFVLIIADSRGIARLHPGSASVRKIRPYETGDPSESSRRLRQRHLSS